jgi:hypothetical protein
MLKEQKAREQSSDLTLISVLRSLRSEREGMCGRRAWRLVALPHRIASNPATAASGCGVGVPH